MDSLTLWEPGVVVVVIVVVEWNESTDQRRGFVVPIQTQATKHPTQMKLPQQQLIVSLPAFSEARRGARNAWCHPSSRTFSGQSCQRSPPTDSNGQILGGKTVDSAYTLFTLIATIVETFQYYLLPSTIFIYHQWAFHVFGRSCSNFKYQAKTIKTGSTSPGKLIYLFL